MTFSMWECESIGFILTVLTSLILTNSLFILDSSSLGVGNATGF